MWEAVADYADGTSIKRLFEPKPWKTEQQDQYEIECWLIERHPGCTFYSVNWIFEEE